MIGQGLKTLQSKNQQLPKRRKPGGSVCTSGLGKKGVWDAVRPGTGAWTVALTSLLLDIERWKGRHAILKGMAAKIQPSAPSKHNSCLSKALGVSIRRG